MLLEIVIGLALFYVLLKIYCKLTLGRCKSPVCLIGKTALVTGGNSGIGFETALALAGRGCRVIIASRDVYSCEKSKEKIIQETGNTNIVIKQFDLASLSSVRKLAKDINDTEERLDILINNAGSTAFGNAYTEDGLHIGMQVNHFGAFLLTHLLVGLLKKSAPSRIIFVSSVGAYFANLTIENLNYPKSHSKLMSLEFFSYSNSKLCNVITAREFARRLKKDGVTSNSVHPGAVSTPLLKKYADGSGTNKFQKLYLRIWLCNILGAFSKNPEEGAQTTIHLALSKEVEKVTGEYFLDCAQYITPRAAKDQKFASEIWKASEDYVKLAPEEKL